MVRVLFSLNYLIFVSSFNSFSSIDAILKCTMCTGEAPNTNSMHIAIHDIIYKISYYLRLTPIITTWGTTWFNFLWRLKHIWIENEIFLEAIIVICFLIQTFMFSITIIYKLSFLEARIELKTNRAKLGPLVSNLSLLDYDHSCRVVWKGATLSFWFKTIIISFQDIRLNVMGTRRITIRSLGVQCNVLGKDLMKRCFSVL